MSAINTNMTFNFTEAYDNEIQVSVAENQPANSYLERDGREVITHSGGNPAAHPTLSGVIKGGESHLLTEGSITIEHTMDSDYTQTKADNYFGWLTSNDQSMEDAPGSTRSYNDTDKKITISYTVEHSQTGWRPLKQKYVPDSVKAKMTLGAGSTLICVTRFAHINDWTVEHMNIQANTSTLIEKEGGTCYVIFASDVTKGSDTLTKFKAYKLSSGNINVTSTANTMVIRLYRA